MYCEKCGAELMPGNKFCISCGAVVSPPETSPEVKKNALNFSDMTAVLSNGGTAFFSQKGETPFTGLFTPSSTVSEILNPVKTLISSIRSIPNNIQSVIKNKKKLISLIILSLVWILLIVLQALAINPFPVKLAAWLTFSQGGASNNIIRIIGGTIGKGVFAAFFVSLLSGGFKNVTGGFKIIIGIIKTKKMSHFGVLLTGAGAALVLYNFMAGYAAVIKSMAGVASFLLIIKAIGGSGGFIKKIVVSFTAKKTKGTTVEDSAAVNMALMGLAAGFALSVLLSIIPWGYTPYCLGLILILTGVIMLIIKSNNKKAVVK